MSEKEVFQFESEEIDIKSILQRYLRYWYLFVLGVILCLGLAFVYLRYATPAYQISSTLLIKDDKKGPDLSGNAVFSDLDLFKTTKNIDNEIQVLKSKSLMQRVLSELSLYTSYYVEGNVKTSEVYGRSLPLRVIVSKLDSAAFGQELVLQLKDNNSFELADAEGQQRASYKFGQEIKHPYGTFTVVAAAGVAPEDKQQLIIRFHDIRKLADYYNKELTVAPVNKEASVLTISLVDPVPEKGKDIINKLIEVYNKEAVEDKNLVAASTIEFIDERLKFLTTELTDVEKNVEQYKRQNELTDVSSEAQLYLQQASEYNKQLAQFEIQLDVLNSIEKYLRQQQDEQFEVVPSTLNIQDPTLLGLITKFNELQLERQRMLRTTKANNPLVQNMTDQLANLKVNILENLQNIKKGLEITRNNLQASSAQFESRIQQVPAMERELLEINRQQGIKEGLYLYLLQKREESALSLAATVSNSRVIDPAMAGDLPVKPKKQLIYLLAILLGMGMPFAFIYIKDLLNDKVETLQEVKKATATPILGEISHSEHPEKLVVRENSRSAVTELFRLARTNLQFSTVGKENKVILVTSSMSGEGKTFFSINLGASLALTGKKVVLVNFDLRKPRLMQDMGLSNDLGITNYLVSEKVAIQDIVTPVPEMYGLYAIGSGPVPPNPAELMMSPKVQHLLETLKETFDYVLLDTAPVGQVADAFTLAPYADSSVFIIRYDYTYKSQIEVIDDIYKQKKLKHPMIVLNDAKKENGYGYGYAYGYGYGESQKKGWKKFKAGVGV
ncbi:GumC family protein [Pontibacter mangrovi]|uniref:Polysaccharide biosynthesis tyrosine autokinase n=1 Tax=Pontibacter mangrovi TaxID=2589816 RepID=A0A501VS16_9BACT|nr:polysaccharide biosynthesis tyrosine autokinase [Pontibacter mangrovi]TPE39988.1 polysaccharide biosynthesis tyrosine autokinase [Pontibacter mangrovi]